MQRGTPSSARRSCFSQSARRPHLPDQQTQPQRRKVLQHHPRLARTPARRPSTSPRSCRASSAPCKPPRASTRRKRSPATGGRPAAGAALPAAWFRHDAACIEMGESTDGAGSSNLYGMLNRWAAAGGQDNAWSASAGRAALPRWVLRTWTAGRPGQPPQAAASDQRTPCP